MSAEVPEAASAEEQKVRVRDGPLCLQDQEWREPWLAGQRGLRKAGLEPSAGVTTHGGRLLPQPGPGRVEHLTFLSGASGCHLGLRES